MCRLHRLKPVSSHQRPGLPAGWLGLLLLGLSVSACNDSGLDDLEQFINQARMKKGTVAPLPKFKPVETFSYSAAQLRDPFHNWQIDTLEDMGKQTTSHGLHPDTQRTRERLEAFPLDTLHLKGTISIEKSKWALVGGPDEIIYRVKIGSHMGRNFGKIVKIEDNGLTLTEIVPDGLGGWQEREARLASEGQ